jgi:hypothetical protein
MYGPQKKKRKLPKHIPLAIVFVLTGYFLLSICADGEHGKTPVDEVRRCGTNLVGTWHSRKIADEIQEKINRSVEDEPRMSDPSYPEWGRDDDTQFSVGDCLTVTGLVTISECTTTCY